MRRMINNRGSFCRIDLNSQQVSARHLFVRLFVCLVGFFYCLRPHCAPTRERKRPVGHFPSSDWSAGSCVHHSRRAPFLIVHCSVSSVLFVFFVFFRAFLSFTIVIDGIVFSVHHFTKKKRYEDSIQSSEML